MGLKQNYKQIVPKSIVITGASSGIGQATRALYKQQGDKIIELNRDMLDLSSANIETTIPQVIAKIKNVDWLIHVAGFVNPRESFDNLDTLEETFNVNLFSAIYLTKAVLPKLNENGGIIFVSSTAGIIGSGKVPLYATSKGGLNTFAQSLAFHFKFNDTSKSAFVVAPGPTNTKMRDLTSGDGDKHQSPESVARVLLDITSGRNQYQNGDIIIVNNAKDSLHSKLAN